MAARVEEDLDVHARCGRLRGFISLQYNDNYNITEMKPDVRLREADALIADGFCCCREAGRKQEMQQRGKMKREWDQDGRDSDRVMAGYFKGKRKISENPGGHTFAASNKS